MRAGDFNGIGVVGAGQMGSGIAQVSACAGYQVSMIDVQQSYVDRGLQTINASLSKLSAKNRITSDEASQAQKLISVATDLRAAENADLVIEAIPEVPELKYSTFQQLDEICKSESILASNTSSISIDSIAKATNRADRVIGMHFMNPVPIMKLVEIIEGSETSPFVSIAVINVAEKMGKTALSCKDSPGFVSNRILCPMLNEAILTLQEGVAEAEAIDGIMKLGMNHPIGPLALADLIGLDTVLHIMNVLLDGFGDEKYTTAPHLVKMVDLGKLGRKSGQGFYTYGG